jgi:hypothetical protein
MAIYFIPLAFVLAALISRQFRAAFSMDDADYLELTDIPVTLFKKALPSIFNSFQNHNNLHSDFSQQNLQPRNSSENNGFPSNGNPSGNPTPSQQPVSTTTQV